MNILIPDSWLREHLKTKATPEQIGRYLSLCSQSVEKIIKKGNDFIYDIEITTNRPDCLSIYGLARELRAILPHFGLKAGLKKIKKAEIPKIKKGLPLIVTIRNQSLCPRFMAIILDQVKIKPSSKIVRERLEMAGIRALNNVIDISNYLMLELGQPMHTFDYDKIKGAKMTLRQAAGGEKITTLDGQARPLPDGTVIIEDGQGRIIDLCGIMGGANSEVDKNTKRVLLFVQTYQPMKIRQACQKMAFRTEAASRFEKGIDPEGVLLAMKKAVAMFQKHAGAKVAGKLIDIYPHPPKPRYVSLSQVKLNQMMGLEFKLVKAKEILKNLGFRVQLDPSASGRTLTATVPHWRYNDITIPQDLVEEVARIYGYHNLPSVLLKTAPPPRLKKSIFTWENHLKNALKFWGFTEVGSYSMVSEKLLTKAALEPDDHLKIANPLTDNRVYLRQSLIPSLLEIVAQNQTHRQKIKIFELANIYLPKGGDKLPNETPMLSGAISEGNFYSIKGIVEAILAELGIQKVVFEPYSLEKTLYGKIFQSGRIAEVVAKNHSLGIIGEIDRASLRRFSIKSKLVAFDLDFAELVKHATTAKKYTPIPKYPAIIEDLSFVLPPRATVGPMIQLIESISLMIQSIKLFDSYKDTRTFRITYQNPKKTLTDKEVGKIRKKIVGKIQRSFAAELKS